MEDCYPLKRENPAENANCISRIFFFWMRKIAHESNKIGLELKNIYKNLNSENSENQTNILEKAWNKEIENAKLKNKVPSLLKAILKTYCIHFISWGLLTFFCVVVLQTIQPLVLAQLIKLFSTESHDVNEIFLYAGLLCGISLLTIFLNHHGNFNNRLTGMRVRVAASALVYRKILKLSQSSLRQTAAGQVVNLLSNDVARFDTVVLGLNYLWIGPFQLAVVIYFMWMQIGPSSMAGVISMLIFTLPLQLFMGTITSTLREKVATRTDDRVKLMSELLSGIQVIKMYTWETPFEKVVEESRKQEVKYLTYTSLVRGILLSFMVFIERATLAATIVCYVLLGHGIRADLVYSLSIYFNLLELTLAMMFPTAIALGAEALVSISRIQDFLLMEEKDVIEISNSDDNSIRLKNVEASWIPPTPILKNLNMTLQPGSMIAVIGPVGSGKSSFLKLLLGELKVNTGTLSLSGNISYASQEPWLFASTVRNNILFGEEYEHITYKNVVKVCALEKDFQQFPSGDKTRISDRGVSLSGGQRARINLARAVYRDSDIYLLDDPLSAVDTKVGKHLFDKCILGYLRGKTRILVTHQLQYLKKADLIIVLNKGSIEAQGTFSELSQSDLDFTKLLVEANEVQEEESVSKKMSRVSLMNSVSVIDEIPVEEDEFENMEDKSGYKGSALFAYVKSWGNLPFISFIVFIFIFCQILLSGADLWVTMWTNQEQILASSISNESTLITNFKLINDDNNATYYEYIPAEDQINMVMPNISFIEKIENMIIDHIMINGEEHSFLKSDILMYGYIVLIIVMIFISITRSLLFFCTCMKASRKLHNKMFHCLLEAPMKFFDTNPAGRVLNRFSKDMGAIDDSLPKALVEVIQILLVVIGILVNIIIANYYMAIVIIVLGVIFMKFRSWYVTTARSIKLIEGVAKSPIFSYVNSSIDGLTTIRATGNEDILRKQFDNHQDVHTSTWYLTVACAESFGLWLDFICVIFLCSVVGGFIILDQYTEIRGSFAGLAISQSLILIGMLQYGMKQIAEVVNYLTSVERVLEYTQLDREHPLHTPKDKMPKVTWPHEGKIIFQRLSLRYVPDDPPVLNNLNLEFLPTEKIGIVGRTGAGKSTLISALFRLAPSEGKILIDGIDTKTLGLKDLRKKISIIPQEPVLFSATMRYNLDPFDEFKDELLWDALEEVELKDKVESLDFLITGGGSNFSVGQRQLICLARAILRNNKILILDEATANVDPKTDEFIQKTIRRKFKKCTVLTIAHRLNTIMDSDKVLVMHFGSAVEFDHPHILLQDPEGHFSKMLFETGTAMTETLKSVACEAYESKFSQS